MPYLCTSKEQQQRDNLAHFYRTEDVWFIKTEEAHETQVLLDFINKRLSTAVPLKLPFTTILMNNVIIFSVLSVLLLLLVKLRPGLIQPPLWWMISMLGYVVCTSGFIYSELHGMPMFRFDKD